VTGELQLLCLLGELLLLLLLLLLMGEEQEEEGEEPGCYLHGT